MGVAQWTVVIVTVLLNALDGFDVLSISFAAPGIALDWGLDQATLGWILAMELIGMGVGSLGLGVIGDKAGRRNTILACLVAMTVGMFGAGAATNITELLAWRSLTGLGIGGMLAVTTAVTAEFANGRWRSLAMSLMVIGYPIGGVLGGVAVQQILSNGTWHGIFHLGGWATAAMIPVVLLLIPESPLFLDRQRRPDALARINRVFAHFGHASAIELTPVLAAELKTSVMDIFRPRLLRTTLLVTTAYFALIISFYFLVKWVPKLVVDMGFEPSQAASVLMWLNVGGVTGGAIFGLLATRFQLRKITIIVLVGAAAMIVCFGRVADDFTALTIVVACGGFFTNSAICGMYSIFANVFPTQVRSTGTGFAIGVGRGGAILAPIGAGYLLQAGFSLQSVALIMAVSALLAATLLFFLKERSAISARV